MTNFIYNNTTVPINKMNAAPLPPGANPAQWGVAAEWITLCQALLDIQGWARGAQWMGYTPLAADPAPAGVADYVWLRNDSTWMHNNAPLGGGSISIGNIITGATVGSLLFAGAGGALAQDNAKLFWNDAFDRLGIGTASPGTTLDIASATTVAGLAMRAGSTTAVSAAGTGRLRYNEGTSTFQVSLNGAAYTDLTTAAPFTLDIGDAIGSSTIGSVLFVGAGNVLQQDNANLFWDDATNRLGIGNAAPAQALHVTGTARITTGIIVDSMTLGSIWFAGAAGALTQDNANLFWDDTNNRLGIGTAAPGEALHVVGNAHITGKLTVDGAIDPTSLTLVDAGNAAYVQSANGASAAVSAANTGRLRYNTTGQKFQVSLNGAAYVDLQTGTEFTIDIGDAIGSSTIGSLLFVGAGNVLQQDNANLFWDDTNNRLGVGNASPALPLHIQSSSLAADMVLLRNDASNGTSGIQLWASAGVVTGTFGFANPTGADTIVASKHFWRSTGSDFVFTFGTGAGASTLAMIVNGTTHYVGIGTNLAPASPLDVRHPATPAVDGIQVYNTAGGGADGRATVLYRSDVTSSRVWSAGIDTDGGTTKQFQIRDVTGGVIRFRLDTTGNMFLPAYTTGSVPFFGASGQLLQANANFFWDDTNNRLGIGTAAPTWALHVKAAGSGVAAGKLETTSTDAYTEFEYYDSSGVFKAGIGYGNSAVAVTHVQSKIYVYSSAPDIVFANATNAAFAFGMTAGSIYLAMQNGSGAAVSAASTGRLRYNTTGQKFQVSSDAAAYLDVALLAASLTTGSVLFAASGNVAQDNANLFFDDANNRLGIGTTAPSVALDLATGTAEAGIQFRIGTTLPVSAASTGRIRYNATSQLFQISKNTAAYEDMASLATAQTFTKSQNVLSVALTDAANIATDASLGNIFTVTLAGNRTLDNPTNLVAGGVYHWVITQDATGARTLAYGALFKWPGGVAPVLTVTANAIDSIEAVYNGTVLIATFALNHS